MSSRPPDSSLPLPALIGFSAALVLIWGSAYTMVGVGVDYIRPIWLVAYRLVIGAVFVTAYMFYKGYRFPKLSDPRWRWYFCLGMSGSILPFFLLATGQQDVDSGITSIMVGVMPLMTVVLAHFFTDETLNLQKFLGFVIGFIGIIILFLPDDFSLSLVSDWKSQALIVAAAFLYAVTTVGAKRAPETPSSVGGAMMLIWAAIVGVIAAFFTGVPTQAPQMMGHLMAWGLGLGSTGLATIMYLYVIQQTGPGMMARINYFVPVASVILGVGLIGEEFKWRMVLSFAIIVLGVMISRIGARKAANAMALNP